jgi:exosome complex protein LRP1
MLIFCHLGTLAVDKDAATRFIQSAIRQATGPQQAAQPPVSTSSGSSSATIAPVKVTDKMRARAEYQAKMKDEDVEDTDEDEDLQVIDESTSEPQSLKRAGKEKAVEHPASSTLPIKRQKRTAMDVIDSMSCLMKNSFNS